MFEISKFFPLTFALSTSLSFLFLRQGDSSKKISEPGGRPRPRTGVLNVVSCNGFVTVLVDDKLVFFRIFSCAFNSSEADLEGVFSSSRFSRLKKNK